MDEQETGMRSKIWNGGAGEGKPLKSEKMIYIGTRNTESKDKIEEPAPISVYGHSHVY